MARWACAGGWGFNPGYRFAGSVGTLTERHYALGSAFIDEFELTTTFLLANPAIGATFSRRFQQFSLRRFPCRIIYRLVKVNDELRILAITHHRRHPAAWRKHPSR